MATLGVTRAGSKTRFALYSKHATGVTVRLFEKGQESPFLEAPLSRSGDIWEASLDDLPESYEYTYRCKGPYLPQEGHLFREDVDLLDPYAQALSRSPGWGERVERMRGVVAPTASFDWEEDARPMLPEEELVLYEMHVRGFTQDPSSGVKAPGTFLGIIEKIPYLKELGVNAVELLPIHAFSERDGEGMNFWGYSTLNFFTPMPPYGSGRDLKEMVKALHREGIEVILDVVYNHTHMGMFPSFEGIDNASYYILGKEGYHNYSGCGNTFNCNGTAGMQLILDSLRYFVTEYHIDGFRFDLASILTRGEDGKAMENPPLIQKITRDSILAPTKLIAEAWDAAGLYQVNSFPSYRFGSWNDRFRDDVRCYIRGNGDEEAMYRRLCGSPDLYDSPNKSYNFVTIHDGFTLCDLVSYNEKKNKEGGNENTSWNCGAEGRSQDPAIQTLRKKQMENFLVALMVAEGIPMLLMGDEYGHTKEGNNNTWCEDNRLNYFQWDALEKESFLSQLIAFRKEKLKKIETVERLEGPSLGLLINKEIVVAFNPSNETLSYPLPEGTWTAPFSKETFSYSCPLHSFDHILLISTCSVHDNFCRARGKRDKIKFS